MPFVLREENSTENPPSATVFGKQITAGKLAYYLKEGGRTKAILFLGDGEMDGLDRVLYNGEPMAEFTGTDRNWKFHSGSITTQIVPKDVTNIPANDTLTLVGGHGFMVNDEVALVAGVDPTTSPYPTGVEQHKKLYVVNVSGNDIKLSLNSGDTAINTWSTTGDDNTYLEANLKVYKADAGYFDSNQGRPVFFPDIDFTFSGIAYLEVWLSTEQSEVEDDGPTKFKIFVRGRRLQNYDEDGLYADQHGDAYPDQNNLPDPHKFFSPNNALVAVDIMTNYMKVGRGVQPNPRINWPSFVRFRDECDTNLGWDAGSSTTTSVFASPTFSTANLTNATSPVLGQINKVSGGAAYNAGGITDQTFDDAYLTDGTIKIQGTMTSPSAVMGLGITRQDTPTTHYNQAIYGTVVTSSEVYSVEQGVATQIPDVVRGAGAVIRMEFEQSAVRWYMNDSLIYEVTSGVDYQTGDPLRGMAFLYSTLSYISDYKISPLVSTTPGEPGRYINKFDAHLAFPGELSSLVALEQVMGRAPNTHWQDVDGQIKFVVGSDYKDLTTGQTVEDGDRVLPCYISFDSSTQDVPTTNVALSSNGAVATASSQYSANFPIASINEGTRRAPIWGTAPTVSGNGWASVADPSVGTPQWVQIDFDSEKSINEIDVISVANPENLNTALTLAETTTNGIVDFKVQYWSNEAWVDIADVTANDKTWRQFQFETVRTSKIRVLITDANVGYARIAEVEAWSTPTSFPTKSNIVADSFATYKKSVEEKQNFLRMEFRDIDDYEFGYTKKYTFKDRPDVRDYLGYLVDFGIIQIGVASQSLADRVAESILRWNTDLDLFVSVKGDASTFALAKGDLVRFAHEVPEWSLDEAPLFIVTEESFETETADERSFILQLYDPTFYSDTAHGAINPNLPVVTNSQLVPPPVAISLDLVEDYAIMPDDKYVASIKGTVEFDEYYTQHGLVYTKTLDTLLGDVTYNSGTNVFTLGSTYTVPANTVPIQLVSTSDNVPTGTSYDIPYYVTNVSGNTFKLSLSPGGGTATTFTSNGSNLFIYDYEAWNLNSTIFHNDSFIATFEVFPAKKAYTLVRVVTASKLDISLPFSVHTTEHIQVEGSQLPPSAPERMWFEYDGVGLRFNWECSGQNVARYRVTDEFNRLITETPNRYSFENTVQPQVARQVYSVSPTGVLSTTAANCTFVQPPRLEWVDGSNVTVEEDKSLTTIATYIGFSWATMKTAVITGEIITTLVFSPHANNVDQGISMSANRFSDAFVFYNGLYFKSTGHYALSTGGTNLGTYEAGDRFMIEDNPFNNTCKLFKIVEVNTETVYEEIHSYGTSYDGLMFVRAFTQNSIAGDVIDLAPILTGNLIENYLSIPSPALNVVNATYNSTTGVATRTTGSGWNTSGLSLGNIPANKNGAFELMAFGSQFADATGIAVGLTNSDTNQNITSMPFWFTIDGNGYVLVYTGTTLLSTITTPSGGIQGLLGIEHLVLERRGTQLRITCDDDILYTYTHASLDTEELFLDIAFNGSLGTVWSVTGIKVLRPYTTALTPFGEPFSLSVKPRENATIGENFIYDIPKFALSSPVSGQYLKINSSLQVENGAFSLSSGMAFSGGGANRIIFEDASQNLSTNSTFVFNGTDMGLGASSPSAKLHVIKTTEQLRVGYDTSNYFKTTVSSSGLTTFDATGAGAGFIFNDSITALNTVAQFTLAYNLSTKYGYMSYDTNHKWNFLVDATNYPNGTTQYVFQFMPGGTYQDSGIKLSNYGTGHEAILTTLGAGRIYIVDNTNVMGGLIGNLYSNQDSTQFTWPAALTGSFNYAGGGSQISLGVNTATPSAALHVIKTTEQLRVGYDSSNYETTTVGSTGEVVREAFGSAKAFRFKNAILATPSMTYNTTSILIQPDFGGDYYSSGTHHAFVIDAYTGGMGAFGLYGTPTVSLLKIINTQGATSLLVNTIGQIDSLQSTAYANYSMSLSGDGNGNYYASTDFDTFRIKALNGPVHGYYSTGVMYALKVENDSNTLLHTRYDGKWWFNNSVIGIGVAEGTVPSASLHIIATTEQLRLGYDASNYFKTTVGASGTTTFDAVGSSSKFIFRDSVETNGLARITGSELITNGTFNTDSSGWTLNGSSSWSGGKIVVSADGVNYPTIDTNIVVTSGTKYILTFDISSATEDYYVYFNDISAYSTLYSGNGSRIYVFESDYTGTTKVYFESNNDGLGTGWSIDNVSLFEISSIDPALVVNNVEGVSILRLGHDIANNIFVGVQAGESLTSGTNNLGIGSEVLESLTTGSGNIVLGQESGRSQTTAESNILIGRYTARYITTGSDNVAVGAFALDGCIDGTQNVAIGNNAGATLTSGIQNVIIGYTAGWNITEGDANILIGNSATLSSPTANAEVSIGQWLHGAGQFSNLGWNFNGGTPVRPDFSGGTTLQGVVDALEDLGLVIGGTASGGGGMSTGSAVTGGGANRILFEDGSQNLSTNSSFLFDGTNMALGVTTASAKLHIVKTTEQLRVGYDTSNYFKVTVGSSGTVTFDAVGSGAKFTFLDLVADFNLRPNFDGFTIPVETSGGGVNFLITDNCTVDRSLTINVNDVSRTLVFEGDATISGTNTGDNDSMCIACSDETTAITTGAAKATFRMPYAFQVTAVRASVATAPTGSTIIIDINETLTSILSTKLSIDISEKTSTTAASAAVISDSLLADDAEITIDFDQVGSTIPGAGVKVWLIGYRV